MSQKFSNLLPPGVMNAVWFMVITIVSHVLFVSTGRVTHSWGWVMALNHWLMLAVYEISVWVNRVVLHFELNEADPLTMIFPGKGYIIIVEGCSGLKQLYQGLTLFLLYPGRWKPKVWFIPLVMVLMFMANVLRIILLSITVVWIPQQWDFVHSWVLRPMIYGVLFLLWLAWVRWYQERPPVGAADSQKV